MFNLPTIICYIWSVADQDKDQVEEQVIRLIKIASEANLYGVICSPHEVKMIKKIKVI